MPGIVYTEAEIKERDLTNAVYTILSRQHGRVCGDHFPRKSCGDWYVLMRLLQHFLQPQVGLTARDVESIKELMATILKEGSA